MPFQIVRLTARKGNLLTKLEAVNDVVQDVAHTVIEWEPLNTDRLVAQNEWTAFVAGVCLATDLPWFVLRNDTSMLVLCRKDYYEASGGTEKSLPEIALYIRRDCRYLELQNFVKLPESPQ